MLAVLLILCDPLCAHAAGLLILWCVNPACRWSLAWSLPCGEKVHGERVVFSEPVLFKQRRYLPPVFPERVLWGLSLLLLLGPGVHLPWWSAFQEAEGEMEVRGR